MDETKLRNLAFTVLSDAKQVGKKRVNLHKVMKSVGIESAMTANLDPRHSSALSYYDDEVHILVSAALNPLENNWEFAYLISSQILNAKENIAELRAAANRSAWHTRFEGDPIIPHLKHSDEESPADIKTLAGYLLCFSFTETEKLILERKNSTKLVEKLAHRKKIPTGRLLERLAAEIY